MSLACQFDRPRGLQTVKKSSVMLVSSSASGMQQESSTRSCGSSFGHTELLFAFKTSTVVCLSQLSIPLCCNLRLTQRTFQGSKPQRSACCACFLNAP